MAASLVRRATVVTAAARFRNGDSAEARASNNADRGDAVASSHRTTLLLIDCTSAVEADGCANELTAPDRRCRAFTFAALRSPTCLAR